MHQYIAKQENYFFSYMSLSFYTNHFTIVGGPKLQSIFQEELTMRLRIFGGQGYKSTLNKMIILINKIINHK
jgi:hypothetical protein